MRNSAGDNYCSIVLEREKCREYAKDRYSRLGVVCHCVLQTRREGSEEAMVEFSSRRILLPPPGMFPLFLHGRTGSRTEYLLVEQAVPNYLAVTSDVRYKETNREPLSYFYKN